jgi:signal peptidase II
VKVLWITFTVIAADQLSKLYIKGISIPFLNIKLTGMYHGESIPVIGNFFKITFNRPASQATGYCPLTVLAPKVPSNGKRCGNKKRRVPLV